MSAMLDLEAVEVAYAVPDAVDLFHRAVFVVHTLDRQHRARDVGQQCLDVPGREGGVEPDVVPAPEGALDISVVARELRAPIAVEKRTLCLGDAIEAVGLYQDVRRHRDHGGDGSARAGGVD